MLPEILKAGELLKIKLIINLRFYGPFTSGGRWPTSGFMNNKLAAIYFRASLFIQGLQFVDNCNYMQWPGQ